MEKESTVYVHLSIHTPHPEHEQAVIDSMWRFGNAAKGQPGLHFITSQKDARTGDLIGLALWESEEAFRAAIPTIASVVADDDFASWERGVRSFELTETAASAAP